MPNSKRIFELRKSGEIEQAYELAQQEHAQFPNDEWVIKAYGWVLYDKLKTLLANHDQPIDQQVVNEIEALNVTEENDELLYSKLRGLIEDTPSHRRRLRKARELDKAEHYGEALVVFRDIRESFIQDTQFMDSYGWCLYKSIKLLVASEPINIIMCKELLEEYLGLQVEKPSKLHSNILRLAEKFIGDDSFYLRSIVKRWGYQCFLPEDWNKYEFEGREYPGLAEKTIQKIAKSLYSQSTNQDIQDFLPALNQALSKIQDNIWLYYYKSKLLLKSGNYNEAEQFLRPVVKMKKTEYWAWALMGDIYKVTSLEKAISCYCKALLCSTDEKFVINTRVSLGNLLLQSGFKVEAKREFLISINTRKENAYGMGEDLTRIDQETWFKDLKAEGENKEFYNENKSLAEEILFADLPWLEANVGDDYVLPDSPDVNRIKLFIKTQFAVSDTTIKEKQHNIYKRFKKGDPVRVKAENQNGKWQIYLLEKREDGKKWDVFPTHNAIIDHVNKEKGVAHFIANKEIEGLIRLDPQKEQLLMGDGVSVSINRRSKEGKTIVEVVSYLKIDHLPSSEICKAFRGRFIIEEGKEFGFIEDVFVDPSLVKDGFLKGKNGRILSGLSVLSYNKNKNAWGWKAVKLME